MVMSRLTNEEITIVMKESCWLQANPIRQLIEVLELQYEFKMGHCYFYCTFNTTGMNENLMANFLFVKNAEK